MHSSRMRTTNSSSRPRGGLHQAPPFCSSVVAFWCGAFWCCGLRVWWPSAMAFWPPKDHTRRLPSIRRPPNQKAITGGHNRRPQQKAITEGHTSPGTRHPPGGETPAARHAGIPPAMHAGIPPPLLQGML